MTISYLIMCTIQLLAKFELRSSALESTRGSRGARMDQSHCGLKVSSDPAIGREKAATVPLFKSRPRPRAPRTSLPRLRAGRRASPPPNGPPSWAAFVLVAWVPPSV
eukprot:scaffold897_cov402-Prasinococcus_capsulatus_cf.AAC.3